MEKYINDTLKWFDENQTNSNAKDLFAEKNKEAEEFFAPIYLSVTGSNLSSFSCFVFNHNLILETDTGNSNTNKNQGSPPKSGKK